MTKFITKDTVNRLLRDVREVIKNPLTDNGIYYVHDDVEMLKGYALIIGPKETPYFGGNYFFEFNYPSDYPHSPPKITYCTNGDNIRFNPNLYKCGKVCISLLNTWRGEQWTSCQTISTVLLTLCTLLCENPLLNEPGVTREHNDFKNYTSIIEFFNIKIAICDILNKKQGIYLPFFELFYHYVQENFLKNYDDLTKFIENKNKEENPKRMITTKLYDLSVDIDYKLLQNKLIECKEKINNVKS
jgi:ubiquitin-conjugating enzyme E2 Z